MYTVNCLCVLYILAYSLAQQSCPAAMPGSLARQPCPAALPGSLAVILQV
jgi:hypothetical protein